MPAHEAGLAAGLINTSQQMGGALGLAILSGIAASVVASGPLTAALAVQGYDRAFLGSAILMLMALMVALVVIRDQPAQAKSGQTAGASVAPQ